MGRSMQEGAWAAAKRNLRPHDIVAGDRCVDDPCWQDVDCDGHCGAAKVVVRMSGDEEDYAYGHALVKLFTASPQLREALEQIVASEGNLYDLKQIAKEALQSIT